MLKGAVYSTISSNSSYTGRIRFVVEVGELLYVKRLPLMLKGAVYSTISSNSCYTGRIRFVG